MTVPAAYACMRYLLTESEAHAIVYSALIGPVKLNCHHTLCTSVNSCRRPLEALLHFKQITCHRPHHRLQTRLRHPTPRLQHLNRRRPLPRRSPRHQ